MEEHLFLTVFQFWMPYLIAASAIYMTICWVIIDNKVYNVTKWLPRHPGGKNLILNLAGKDCTEEFKIFHLNPNYARLRPFLVGEIVAGEVKEETPLAKDVAKLLTKLKKKGAFEPDCKCG